MDLDAVTSGGNSACQSKDNQGVRKASLVHWDDLANDIRCSRTVKNALSPVHLASVSIALLASPAAAKCFNEGSSISSDCSDDMDLRADMDCSLGES